MNTKKLLAVACLASLIVGCVSYNGAVFPGDDLVDEGNQSFAKKAAQDYAARQKFQRPVVIQEAEGVSLFLSPNYVPRSNNARANELCRNIETRRALLQSAKAKLREVVMGLKDLKLTGEAEAPMVAVSADNQSAPAVYRITYNIANLDLQLRESRGGMDLIRAASSKENKVYYEWVASVTVEVRMLDPNGNSVFTFNAIGTTSQTDDGSLNPNMTMLEQAAAKGVDDAMRQYAHKFGPPIYVTDTCQNGEFVRLSVGSDYGVVPGMRVEFFRHREKKALDGSTEMAQQRVGTGVVGKGNAPVEPGCAWAHVDGFDDKNRTVFQWTSAKLIKGEGSTGSLTIPGLDSVPGL